MLKAVLLSLLASWCAFLIGFLVGVWWRGRRLERIVVVPTSPPMRPPPPEVESMTRSPYAPRPEPIAKRPPPTERVVRWRHDVDNSPLSQTTKPPSQMALPKAPTFYAGPDECDTGVAINAVLAEDDKSPPRKPLDVKALMRAPTLAAAPAEAPSTPLLPSITWGRSCMSK